ncbi:hypothetical protein [Clostridium butanoliproducens]|uniref:hypothetical protein n=1 Tax=Clostridium butanoliproducens TaxID=2991837 RepID=UPI0024BA3029|nr:hypothetical protein [Clostridium butanoliproducens]
MKMKKVFLKILSIFLICFSFVGCNAKKGSEEKLITDFITTLYTFEDYDELDVNEYIESIPDFEKMDPNKLANFTPKDKYSEKIKPFFTEDALVTFAMNKRQSDYIISLAKNKVSSKVTNVMDIKETSDGVYNFKAIVEQKFSEKKLTKNVQIQGQLTLEKIDNKLVISQINKIDDDGLYKGLEETK